MVPMIAVCRLHIYIKMFRKHLERSLDMERTKGTMF